VYVHTLCTIVAQLTEHQFNHILVYHSVTVCFRKLLLFADSQFPVSLCVGSDRFFKFFWFLFFFLLGLGGFYKVTYSKTSLYRTRLTQSSG